MIFNSNLISQVIDSFVHSHSKDKCFEEISSMLKEYITSLPPDSAISVLDFMKIINAAYHKATLNHTNRSFFARWGLARCKYTSDLLAHIRLLVELSGDNTLLPKLTNPIDSCYTLARYFLNKGDIDNAKVWLDSAVQLGGLSKISSFLENIDPKWIKEFALANDEIALFVIKKMRSIRLSVSVYSLDKAALIEVLFNVKWTEKTAAKAIPLLLPFNNLDINPPLIDHINHLSKLREFSEVNFILFNHPALFKLKGTRKPYYNYEKPVYNMMSTANPVDDSMMREILKGAAPFLIKHIELQVNETKKIRNFIFEAKRYKLIDDNAIADEVKNVFIKLEEKAMQGHTDFERLVGDWYCFYIKDLEKGCAFLLKAALKGDQQSIQTLQVIAIQQNSSAAKYSLGVIHLFYNEPQIAKEYFREVSKDSKMYEEAQFELANIQLCTENNKEEAFISFSNIKSSYISNSKLLQLCKSTGKPHSVLDVYKMQPEKAQSITGLDKVSLPQEINEELPTSTNTKEVSQKKLEEIWSKYNDLKQKKMFKRTSKATFEAYNNAKLNTYNDEGRYTILKNYVSNPENQGRDFYKIIIQEFAENFFEESPSHSLKM